MNSKYTTPKLEVAIKYRVDRNKFINENYCPRIPTEDNRWTQEELDTLRDKVNKDRPLCKFGASCDRLQCAYSHPLIRTGICKDFRWCEGDKCVLYSSYPKILRLHRLHRTRAIIRAGICLYLSPLPFTLLKRSFIFVLSISSS